MKVQIVTPYRVCHLQRYGFTLRGNVTSGDGYGGLAVSMLASGFRVRGFKPGRSRWIFNEC
jgi:hypothetical protein